MLLNETILSYIEAHQQEALDLLLELAQIPAPSHHEELRAGFCKTWLEKQGAQGVYIDDALNVIYPIGVGESNPLVVYMAHSDVVFPDTEPLPLRVEDGKILCPGVGDDTANVAALLTVAQYIAQNGLQTADEGVLLVINSGEEGLGNLKGSRKIMQDFGSRIREFISLDGGIGGCVVKAVGSRRYRVAVRTEGGHSYGAFGNRNAIAYLASLIDTLYTIKVPPIGKTTFNVGTISGGTSVNTIAQSAEMLYEYRSDDKDCLEQMRRQFFALVEEARCEDAGFELELVGERPCGSNVPKDAHGALIGRCSDAIEAVTGNRPTYGSSSTDANIPLSKGIPAVTFGLYSGAKAHTREEYVVIDTLETGLKIGMLLVTSHFEK